MSLTHRLAKLEKQMRSLASRRSLSEPEYTSMEFTLSLWQVYARPGDPPLPAQPITLAECEAARIAVYGLEAAPAPGSQRPCRASGHQPPPLYVEQWQRTGQVAHPLLRHIIAAYTGDQVVPDNFYQKPESDPDGLDPDLLPAGPCAPRPESQ